MTGSGLHAFAVAVWTAAWIAAFFPSARRSGRVFVVEHAAFAVAVVSGFGVMAARGWGLGHSRSLAVKVGLTAFLFIPLEGFHAYICHVFLPRAGKMAGAFGARQVERGVGLESIIRTIAMPLFGIAIPLAYWLALKAPF